LAVGIRMERRGNLMWRIDLVSQPEAKPTGKQLFWGYKGARSWFSFAGSGGKCPVLKHGT
jgi:hypothetical protein